MKLAVVLLTLIVYGAAKTDAHSLTEGLKAMENENPLTRGLAQTEMNGVAAIKRAFEQVMEDMTEDDQDMKIAKRSWGNFFGDIMDKLVYFFWNVYGDVVEKMSNPKLFKCAGEVILDMTCKPKFASPAKPPAQSPGIKAQMHEFKRAVEQALEGKTEDDKDMKVSKKYFFDILRTVAKSAFETLLHVTCTPN